MVLGSNPAAATSFRNFCNSVYPALPYLPEETPNAVGPFYLVSMPGEVKYVVVARMIPGETENGVGINRSVREGKKV